MLGGDLPIYESDERVEGMEPVLVTRFRWRAERRARKLNAQRLVPFYRYEVQHGALVERGKKARYRWAVVAMQNLARPPEG